MKNKIIWFSCILFILSISVMASNNKSSKSEARLLWVSRWMYNNEKDVRDIVKKTKESGFNILIFQVRGNATVYYKSKLEPMDQQIGGDTAKWDPLSVAIDEARKQGIEIHAWVNVYPAWRGKTPHPSSKQLWNAHPDWFCVNREGKPMGLSDDYAVLSPGIPEVKDHLYNVFMELVKNYDIDGLHFDYMRYFGPDYSWDSVSLARFQQHYNSTPAQNPEGWNDFRRQQVTDLVKRTYEGIQKIKPNVVLSSAVWGHWGNGFNEYYQDSHGWLAQGIIDFICPMSYTPDLQIYENYTRNHMFNTHGRFIFSGMGVYTMRNPEIMLKEMEINRKYPNLNGIVGHTFFDWSGFYKRDSAGEWIPTNLQKALVEGPFKESALVPEMSWKKSGKSDNVGPFITDLQTEPKIIQQGEFFHIKAKIMDNSGLAEISGKQNNLTLVYMNEPFGPKFDWNETYGLGIGLSKPPMGLVGLKPIGKDEYITENKIHAPKTSTSFYYKILAADKFGNVNDSELTQVPVYYPTEPYSQVGEFGKEYQVGQFVALDKNNKIWLCEVKNNSLRVFNTDGRESNFSPVTIAMNQDEKEIPLINPSGLSVNKSGYIYATHGTGSNSYITLFDPSNGKAIWGLNLKYAPGDMDIDEKGNLYVIEKLRGRWHIYNSEGKEYAGSPFSHVTTESQYINRGITVTPNGRTVYIAAESGGEILKYKGSISRNKANYKQAKSLVEVSGASGAIDLDNNGNIYVSNYGMNCINVFNKNEKHILDIVGGNPELKNPRGVAVSKDGKTLYILIMDTGNGFGKLQKWNKNN